MSIYGLLLRSKLPGLFGDPLQPNLTAPPPYPVGGIRAPAPPLSLMGPGPGSPAGLLVPGNIDLAHRPVVRNRDGSISTVRSISVNVDGREVLIPTVSDDGRILSNAQAVAEFRRTGRHLGMFRDPGSATQYAQRLHEQQAQMYAQPNAGLPTRSPDTVPVSPPIPALAAGPRSAPVPPTAPPVVQGGADPRGIAGVLSRIFAGQGDPNLSPEQNRRAAHQAMLRAGLATLAASSDGEHPGLSAVAAGALYGQQSGDQARQDERQKAQSEALSAMVQAGALDADQLRQMATRAYAMGDHEGARVLAEMARDMAANESTYTEKGADGLVHVLDRRTGQDVRTFQGQQDFVSGVEGNDYVVRLRSDPSHVVSRQPTAVAGQTMETSGGTVSVNPYTHEVTPVMGPDGQPLRATNQAETTRMQAAQGAQSALTNYRGLVQQFARLPAAQRALAGQGLGPGAVLGSRVQAAQNSLLLQVKDLAALGALAGPDLDLVLGLIGDPTSLRGSLRNPQTTLAQLDEAERFIRSKSQSASQALPVAGGRVISDMHDTRDGGRRPHEGIDVQAPAGTPVAAPPRDGVVSYVGENDPRGGRNVTVRFPDGSRINYAHLRRIADGIRRGATVRAGQVVGEVGNTGNARDTVSHVHTQAHDADGNLVDPRTMYAQPAAPPEGARQYDPARAQARGAELKRLGRTDDEIIATLRREELIP